MAIWRCWGFLRSDGEISAIFLRQRFQPALAVADRVNSFPGGDNFTRSVEDFIAETDGAPIRSGDPGANKQNVVKSRRPFVAAIGLGYDDKTIVLNFHLLVFESEFAAKLDAAHLKPGEVISVIDHSHLIGLCVANANLRFGVLFHRGLLPRPFRRALFEEGGDALAKIRRGA